MGRVGSPAFLSVLEWSVAASSNSHPLSLVLPDPLFFLLVLVYQCKPDDDGRAKAILSVARLLFADLTFALPCLVSLGSRPSYGHKPKPGRVRRS